MAFLFYVLGWLSILGGGAWSGYTLYNGITIQTDQSLENLLKYLGNSGLVVAGPGLWYVFCGLLLLAVGGLLSRLDEIAYNTRQG